MLFIGGHLGLLILEVVSPFFGYWHGISLLTIVLINLGGARMLNHYSTRMINNLWLLKDGKTVEVQYMNAFFLPKSEKLAIRNFGYWAPSRVYNVSLFTYQQTQTLYMNLGRNVYKDPEYTEVIKQLVQGREIYLGVSDNDELQDRRMRLKKRDQH